MKIVGIVLIAAGILALVYQGITYTKKENVMTFGDMKITADEQKTIPLSPVIGAVAIVVGAGMLYMGAKKS